MKTSYLFEWQSFGSASLCFDNVRYLQKLPRLYRTFWQQKTSAPGQLLP